MRAAQYYGLEDIRLEDVDAPEPGPGEILVDVAACGICGSDLHFYTDGFPHEVDYPVTLGHEIGGTVAETTEGVEIAEGTEVVLSPHIPCGECWCCAEGFYNLCRDLNATAAEPGGFAEQVVVPEELAVPLPDGIDPETAAVAQPVTVGLHAVRESPLTVGDSVAVVGAGPIGLGALRFAKLAGAGPIYVSEPQAFRRSIAADYGADVVVDPTEEDFVERVHDETGRGADLAFEAVGHGATLDQAIKATRPGGHTTVIGVFGGGAEVEPQDLVRHQRSVAGSTSHQLGPRIDEEYGPTLRALASGDLDAGPYVSSRIDLEDVVTEGFEALLDDEREEIKILVRP
ncbi:MAG: zinc-binding dehydrogenase [Haloarculaceae archaeon]